MIPSSHKSQYPAIIEVEISIGIIDTRAGYIVLYFGTIEWSFLSSKTVALETSIRTFEFEYCFAVLCREKSKDNRQIIAIFTHNAVYP